MGPHSQGQRDPLKSMRLYNVKVISTDIFGTKRATGDPRVSKRPYFLGRFGFPKKKLNFWIVDFRISGFLHFFGFLSISLELRELPEIRWCQNDRNFKGFTDLQFFFLGLWISGFLDFFP